MCVWCWNYTILPWVKVKVNYDTDHKGMHHFEEILLFYDSW